MTKPTERKGVTLHHGDALEVLAALADESVDAVVTDPPYELRFMGRTWDRSGIAYNVDLWKHCLRVLKPGGHLLAFGGTRTYHRLTCAIEDAGFEIRDEIAWLYGSGFPKSLDVSKAIDAHTLHGGSNSRRIKAATDGREVVTHGETVRRRFEGSGARVAAGAWLTKDDETETRDITAPATDDAARWSGWGTALKPAHEPIVVARKPLAGTVAANVLAHGTGALNVDGCRVEYEQGGTLASNPSLRTHINGGNGGEIISHEDERRVVIPNAAGRWPSNVVLDEYAAAEVGNEGRYFPIFKYQAKAPTRERPKIDGVAHPTVKPLELMRWLVRLITPPGGVVLDPFAGSGTTAEACIAEGFRCIAVEREETYLPLTLARIDRATVVEPPPVPATEPIESEPTVTDWTEYGENSVEATIPRDRYGRPLIIPPGGGKPKPYTRVTTFAGTLEDNYGLGLWQQRMVALGLAARRDLLLSVAAHNTDSDDDKRTLNDLVEQAKEAAGASAAATRGTALHRLAERMDAGTLAIADAPEDAQADLRAYAEATLTWQMHGAERFVVIDDLEIAGTFDREMSLKPAWGDDDGDDVHRISDIKTGSTLDYGVTKMAVQLALYALGQLYDPKTGERTPLNVAQDRGVIIHLPAGKGRCDLYWIDLEAGRKAIEASSWVRGWRKRKDLLSVVQIFRKPAPIGIGVEGGALAILNGELGATPVPALEQIANATKVEHLEDAWRQWQHEWTDEMTAAAAKVKAVLTADPRELKAEVNGAYDLLASRIARARTVPALEKLWAENLDSWTTKHTDAAKKRRAQLERRPA